MIPFANDFRQLRRGEGLCPYHLDHQIMGLGWPEIRVLEAIDLQVLLVPLCVVKQMGHISSIAKGDFTVDRWTDQLLLSGL